MFECVGTPFSKDLQWLDLGHKDSSPSYDHQGDIPYWSKLWRVRFRIQAFTVASFVNDCS